MKKILYFLVFFQLVLSGKAVFAQQSDISAIIPSPAPAFTILGTSPTEISKPNSWNALQTSLVQNFTSNNQGVIPKNFALEISPYWLSDHPTFTYKNYLDDHNFSLRNLSLSIATSKVQYGADSVQGMGFGFRIPIKTFSSQAAKKALNDFIEAKRVESTSFQSFFYFYVSHYRNPAIANPTVGNFMDDLKKNITTPPDTTWKKYAGYIQKVYQDTISTTLSGKDDKPYADYKEIIETCITTYFNTHNQQIAADITKQISSSLKDAANLEVSGALAMVFPTNQFSYSRISRFGLWSDYTFKVSSKANLDGTVALRYVRDFKMDSVNAVNNFDLLGRLNIYTDSKQKFSLSAWALVRLKSTSNSSIVVDGVKYYSDNSSWDNKYGVDITYKVSDNVAFAYSFGKGYGADSFSLPKFKNQLLSFLSLYYSINTKVSKIGDQYLLKSL